MKKFSYLFLCSILLGLAVIANSADLRETTWGTVWHMKKIFFTQEDENEFINSSTDGELDLGATSSINFPINGTEQIQIFDGVLRPTTDNDIDLGTTTLEYKDFYLDGIANIDSLVADSVDINGGTIDSTVIGGASAAAGTFTDLTSTGDTALGNGDDTITLNPTAGVSFSDKNITNVADITLDTISADDGSFFTISDDWTNAGNTIADLGTVTTVDINGGTIDGTVIGGSSATTGTFTNVTATTGYISFNETTTPGADTNYGKLYTKTDNHLYFQDGAGGEHLVHAPAFSSMWFHGSATALTISTEDALTKVTTFINIGAEDESGHATANITNDEITLADEGGGKYSIGFGSSLTATGAAKEFIMVTGIELATPLDITNVTDDTVSPIVITSVAHGLFNGDMVEISGVLVNTAANGSFMLANKTADTFEIVALDDTATTGNGDYDEGSPTGDVIIWFPGCMTVHAVVSQTTIQVVSAPGTPIIELSESDKIGLYVANLDDTTDPNLSVVTISLNRLDAH